MKKLTFVFLLLFFIYMLFNLIFSFSSKGHTITYKIQGEFEVEEQYDKKENHYFITITMNDYTYPILVMNEFSAKKEIIEAIASIEIESYQCIYPIFKNEQSLTDVLCMKEGIIYPYRSIENPSLKLVQFAAPFVEETPHEIKDKLDFTKLYNTLPNNHYLGITNYKGLYLANEKITNKELFTKDSYNRSIQLFTPKYYITADYDQTYEFNEFSVVNLETGKTSTIVFDRPISMDGYIQGFVEDDVYLIDRNAKKQYQISLTKKTVQEVGNLSDGMKVYRDGEWEIEKFTHALQQEYYFNTYTADTNFLDQTYVKVDQVGKYTYLYKSVGNYYEVYRSIEKTKPLQYLFTVENLENIVYIDQTVYFKKGKEIKMYQDKIGIVTIFEDSELEFNQNLRFGIYERE